uniref:J domain-containing protein n=1 Tax=Anopheles culicifacies TaxID=139723 RepID=A0A182M3A6_9DIPT
MSSQSYYAALGVREDAPMSEICQAYQHYAPLCHPDSSNYDPATFPIKDLGQQEYWLLINEACEVLTNAEWRARYNVGTLKLSLPVYEFSGDCMEIYQKFIICPRSVVVMPSEGSSESLNVVPMEPVLYVPSLAFFLDVELEEFFHGTTKTIVHARLLNVEGRAQTSLQTLAVTITPYMRHGGSFLMKGCGHEIDHAQSDVLVKLRQIPHPLFVLSGDDLIYNATVPLSTALFGGSLKIVTIDRKPLSIYIHPPFPTERPLVKRFKGEGMKTQTGRGNLIVNIYVKIPYVPLHMRDRMESIVREMEQFIAMDKN